MWSWSVRLKRPNFSHVELRVAKNGKLSAYPSMILDTDGQSTWRGYPETKEYQTYPGSDGEPSLKLVSLLGGFFDPDTFVSRRVEAVRSEGLLKRLALVGNRRSNRDTFQIIQFVYQPPGAPDLSTEEIWVGSDRLIHRMSLVTKDRTMVFEAKRMTVNIPMAASTFAYHPTVGMKRGQEVAYRPNPPIPIGSSVPDFRVFDPMGKAIRLSDFKGRIVVLDFWATWCGNCLQAFPANDALASDLRDQGVVVLAADVGDRTEVFQKWLKKNPNFQAITFSIDPESVNGKGFDKRIFKGIGLPTTLVIDRGGIVRDAFIGYEGKTTDDQLKAAVQRLLVPGM